MTVRGYQLAADWSRQGVYTGTLEDMSSYVDDGTDIEVSWGRDQVRALADATAGKLSFALRNDARLFSTTNLSSPIAGKVLPGTPVRLNVTDPATGGITTVFGGPVAELDPSAPGKTFTASCSDGWGKPGDSKLSTPVYQGLRTGDLINVVLDAIGWPSTARAIDPGATLVPYWWVDGQDAATAVNDLVHSEGPPAIAYVQNGIFYFRDRHHRLLAARSATSQGTYTLLLTAVSTANQLANPTFEVDAANWTGFNGATLARSGTAAHSGGFSLRITPDGVTAGPYAESEQHALPAGFEWTASAWFFNGVAWPGGVSANMEWYDAGHGYITVTQGILVPLPAGVWTQVTVRGWAPANAAYVSMNAFVSGTPAGGNLFYVDDPSLAPVPGHKILKDSFSYNDGLANTINSATLEVAPRIPGNRQVVWSTDDPIVLGASESVTLVIRTDDPFVDLQVPQSLVSYLEDGTFTYDYHVAQGNASFALSRTSGQSALLTITAGLSGVFLDTGVRVRGTPLKQGAARKFTAANPVSANTFGDNDWGGDAPWAYFYDADVLVNKIVNVYGQARPSVSFEIDGVVSAATLTEVLGQQISDRITVRNDDHGVNSDFMVERLTHTIRTLGVRHRLKIDAEVVEPTQAVNPFTFDTSGKGFDQGQFGMDAVSNAATMFMFDTAAPTTQGFGAGVFAS